jgi:tRNA dimethylallyltransferase
MPQSPLPPVIVLAGPTASGKSGLALELCRRLPERTGHAVEIVSVDSAQVYRGMDIGTAKPDAATRAAWPHHLLDLLDPLEAYSAARFARDAAECIAAIRARGHIPLLVGGTLLYLRALFDGLSELPPADPLLRARLAADARALGWPALHARLAAIQPQTAARLHPNDAQRIQRALEIAEWAAKWTDSAETPQSAARRAPPIAGTVLRFAILPPDRAILHRRIETRFHGMIAAGFVDEVRQLRERGDLHADLPSMRAVGYRQIWQHLEGEFGLDEAVQRGIAATRQYAKRQLTWLRADPLPVRIDDAETGAATLIDRIVKSFLLRNVPRLS